MFFVQEEGPQPPHLPKIEPLLRLRECWTQLSHVLEGEGSPLRVVRDVRTQRAHVLEAQGGDPVSAWWCGTCHERFELCERERLWPELYVNGTYGPSLCAGRIETQLDGRRKLVRHVMELVS